MDYRSFCICQARRGRICRSTGDIALPEPMFPHQAALTRWALRKGRAAIFADTGLGKSRMQIAWADAVHRAINRPILILAPLAVAQQTARKGGTSVSALSSAPIRLMSSGHQHHQL